MHKPTLKSLMMAMMLPATTLAQVPLSPVAPAPAARNLELRAFRHASGPQALPSVRFTQDPADQMFRNARQMLSRGNYEGAAEMFEEIRDEHPRSQYVPESYYWQAFALARIPNADTDDLREASELLAQLKRRHPNAQIRDADALAATIQGRLAQLGDSRAAQQVTTAAGMRGCPDDDDEGDMRAAALNALLQMDADNAIPILREIMQRRDECSAPLRRKAVFLISQKRSSESLPILLAAVRSDPDAEVKEQAVFWLSQVGGDEAVGALEDIVRNGRDRSLQDKAIFALSQHNSRRSAELLRDFARRADVPNELREKAIFWLGQRNDAETGEFLRSLYGQMNDAELKNKVIFAMSQRRGSDNAEWLLNVAADANEDVEVRKQALFWAGQHRAVPLDRLISLYDRTSGRELKEQLIFVYSQRRDAAAVDKLMAIARNDGDAELRKRAVFWLGQSKDPRAARFLLEIINN